MYFFSYNDTLATKPNPLTLNPNALRPDSTARFTPPRSGFVHPVTAANGGAAAKLRAEHTAQGLQLHIEDALIAAIALEHKLTLATRNTRDFTATDVQLVNPWDN